MSSHIAPRIITSPSSPAIPPHHVSTHHQTLYTQDSLGIPLGKYYPSNYKYVVSTTIAPVPDQIKSLTMINPETGLWFNKRGTKKKNWLKSHDQKATELTMKLQQYQREMIAQARNVAKERKPSLRKLPERVMLHPIETGYDRITPFELAGTEASGYITEGERRRFESQQGVVSGGSKSVDDIKEKLIKIIST
ncbi:hypothetical protein HI914_00373 [Erysiphe necator]|uniref:Uncharacterized protein n=1 Tax=Uncinula necator TaxID=52586 RepID=A0A0B1NZ17_UNCNE|nr:hypothetical protein HI914_00373 [Erysiphe necator]KHJ31223.1 hypothetical protein EV44_g4698 [Erysiphe necator]